MISDPNLQENARSPQRAVARGLADLGHDALVLIELQAKLARAEADEAVGRIVTPIVALASAGIIALASLPVLLVSLGFLLKELTILPYSACFAISAGVGLLLAAIAGGVGYILLRKLGMPFPRSQTELRRNFDWIRQHLRSGGSRSRDDR